MKKIALVLEGGGLRGAYTAGCLSWLIENNIEINNCYGISTGAIHLSNYLLKDLYFLNKFPCNFLADKKIFGLNAFFKEGRYVAYDFLFDEFLKNQLHYDISKLKSTATNSKLGVYDLNLGKCVYIKYQDLDDDFKILKAACTLPIVGKPVSYNNHLLLDGGITDMLPIDEAIKDECNTFLVVGTKPIDFIRKKANFISLSAVKLAFKNFIQVFNDYKVRHLNYNKQITTIKKQVEKGNAIYMYPSKSFKISRFKANKLDLESLYKLGISDMEKNKESILKLLKD